MTTLAQRLVSAGVKACLANGAWMPMGSPRPPISHAQGEEKEVSASRPRVGTSSKKIGESADTRNEKSAQALVTQRPGCVAADDVLVVKGQLEGLIEGKRGWPVLSSDAPARLREAARGAELMGEKAAAEKLLAMANKLPRVRDIGAARAALEELIPLRDLTWELARRCGGGDLSPEMLAKVRGLAQDVRDGKMTKEEAVAQLKGGAVA